MLSMDDSGGSGPHEDSFFETVKYKLKTVFNTHTDRILLPPALREGDVGYRPYSLVISDDVLLASVHQPASGGMLTKKRPAAEYFLATLAGHYEITIFSLWTAGERAAILDKLDPHRYAQHRLFRDSTLLEGGAHIKDLALLGRDLARTICLDTEASHVKQQENLVVVEAYAGLDRDRTLMDLLPFLLVVGKYKKPDDVRPFIERFRREPEVFDKVIEDIKLRMAEVKSNMKTTPGKKNKVY